MKQSYELFIYFGYLPKFREASLDWLDYDPDCVFDIDARDEKRWIQVGVQTIRETMARQIADTPANALHVIPLSGGLDSRFLLGSLLEALPGSQIATMTFGIPGAWDYEIGKRVASKTGVRHEIINLLNEEWDLHRLVDAGKRLSNPINIYEAYVNQKIRDYFGPDCVYWSGFMAGSLAGVHLSETPSANKEQAIRKFMATNCLPEYRNLTFREEVVRQIAAEFPWQDSGPTKLCLDQQLDYGIRQRYYIHNVLAEKGFMVKTPFTSRTWLNFILCIPYPWYLHEYLYRHIVYECHKPLFKLPVTNSAGTSLFASHSRILVSRIVSRIKPRIIRKDPYGSHPRMKYTNFSESLRHPTKLQSAVWTALQDLIERGIQDEADIRKWWSDHLTRKADYTRLLLNLSSLELLLQSGNFE